MIDPDLTGARPSNAGDEFHELWTLQQALRLLDYGTELHAVLVEGLRTDDEAGSETGTWEGVDCAFYYGGDTVATANRIFVDQMKYSSSDPDKTWTVARLCRATNKDGDNSVVARLAVAFANIRKKRPDLEPGCDLVVRLVSNQRAAPALISALSGESGAASQREKLRQASGLDPKNFDAFAEALDLSETGASSRYALDDAIVAALASLTEEDARASRDELMRWIRTRMMMPDRPREPITRADILIRLAGSADPSTLFPCEPALKRIAKPIPRATAQATLARMRDGVQRLAIVGEGGCGKTTALFEIEEGLPTGSEMVVFDCYGAGSYLDSDAYRHRSQEAFLQLANDLARQLRTPLLVSRTETRDWPRTFKRRLVHAAKLVAARNQEALLVVAVDAADNAVIAAETSPHEEHSFVPDFVSLGDLPANVCLLVSARLGRLDSLALPERFERHILGPFTPSETAAHARKCWPKAPDSWVEDLHVLSGGNPRVQAYALDQAGADVVRATDVLLPAGKSLDAVFRESFEAALLKTGRHEHVAAFCAALIGLPRPAPVRHLAAVTELNEAQVCDLVADLRTGGLRLEGGTVGFADEDLEHFVREAAGDALSTMQVRIADHLWAKRSDDVYAATHVASALLASGRRIEIVDLAKEDVKPSVIADPVQRRAVQLQRLRTGAKVCREAGNVVDATMTILAGAEAVRTDAAVTELLIENPDLAVRFAPDNVSQILRDSEMIRHHGSLLMHRMAEDSRKEDGAAVREGMRRLRAWYRRRDTEARSGDVHLHDWPTSSADNAAVAEALCQTEGPGVFQQRLRHWSPLQALTLAVATCGRIAMAGDHELLVGWLTSAPPPRLYRFVPLTHLALAGFAVDIEELIISLERVARVGMIDIKRIDQDYTGDRVYADLLDLFVTGCEILFNRGASSTRVSALLDRLRPPSVRQHWNVMNVTQFAMAMRAHAICETIAARNAIGDTFLVDESDSDVTLRDDRRKQAEVVVAAAAPTYALRARVLAGTAECADLRTPANNESYRLDGFTRLHVLARLRGHAAVAAARLCHIPGIVAPELAQHVLDCAKSRPDYLPNAGTAHLSALALRREWHDDILAEIAHQASEIRQLRATAEEKSSALARLASILAPVSEHDAQALFEGAVAAAGEVNRDLAFALETLTDVIVLGTEQMTATQRRDLATDLVVAASDIGLRLDNTDAMPWEAVTEALIRLDPGVGLAALARWDDESIVHRRTQLPTSLKTGLKMGTVTAERATALSALIEHTEPKLIAAIAEDGKRKQADLRRDMAEELARDECLYHGHGKRADVLDCLQRLANGTLKGGWIDQLDDLVRLRCTSGLAEETRQTGKGERTATPKRPDLLTKFEWRSARWTTPDTIDATLNDLLGKREEAGSFFSPGDVLDLMARTVKLGDRTAHLEAIVASRLDYVADWELGGILKRRLAEWGSQPSVERWRRERLLSIVAENLPAFCYGLIRRYATLPDLLKATEASDTEIRDALLSGVEQNINQLDAPTLYALIGVTAEHAPPDVAAAIATGFAARLVAAVPDEYHRPLLIDDIPSDPSEATARFLYALMSDVEVPLRWRAAHAVRRLARLGDTAVIDSLIGLLDRRDEKAFRDPDAPFYWLSARLWLLIALDRVADEAPHALAPHVPRLLAVATDEELPHVLMRAFAASTVEKLAKSGAITLTSEENASLAAVNAPALQARPSSKAFERGFGHSHFESVENRRYSFDTMDTLPYWYEPASRIFAEVRSETFLDVAEAFIIDQWSDGSVERAWDRQPRRNRLNQRNLSTMHRHGSVPSLERWDTHLEWHAMFCTVGALLKTHSPAQPDEYDDYYTPSTWMRRKGLSTPPNWLSDQLAPKPAEPDLWRAPTDPDTWFVNVVEEELRTLAGLYVDGPIIVAGRWNVSSRRVDWTADVMSALLAPDTAEAMLRELASMPSQHDYILPSENEELTVVESLNRFVGWIRCRDGDLGLDEHDPLRNGIQDSAYAPGRVAHEVLRLKRAIEVGRLTWRRADEDKAFVSEEWGVMAGDQDERRMTYMDHAQSYGHRLHVTRPALLAVLDAVGHDLILRVTQTKRKNGDDGKPRYFDDEARSERTCLYLLRRDGSLHSAEGCLGFWASPDP